MYKVTFVLLLFISCFSGHILFKPQVSIYLALLFFLNKYDKDYSKKRILLVSNMYPSKKNKHYGSFVKNVYNLLKEDNFIINKNTITKHSNKFVKLLAYIKLHLITIIDGTIGCYDYIYIHFVSHSSLGGVIVKKIKPNIKLILNPHGNDIVPDFDFEEKNVKRSKKYLKEADTIVVPSRYFATVVKENYKIKEDKIFIYPSGGVNTTKFKKIDKDTAKNNCGLDKKKSYIGFVSRFEKDKGYDTFVEAINILVNEENITKYHFVMVGSGSEEEILQKLIKKYKIGKYITIKNMVTQDELVNIYNSLDIFVLPTFRKSDSLTLVGLEAMACEIPVIVANNYGPTDYVKDGVNGYFFEPKSSRDLVDKIVKVSMSKSLNKIVKEGRKTAILYDAENTKNRIIEVFSD